MVTPSSNSATPKNGTATHQQSAHHGGPSRHTDVHCSSGAVEEAGGFAGFRGTATKTNSLIDRLRKLTHSALSVVEASLESYTQTKERAEEIEAKIERTDKLIDEIVYDLYGLTGEVIEIVEKAVFE